MKKLTILFIILLIGSIIPYPAIGDTYYLILLKNGGKLVTPTYWFKGDQAYFFYAGGIVGVGREVIDRFEKYERETSNYMGQTDTQAKDSSPLPPVTEKVQEPAKLPEAKEEEDKTTIADYKRNKDKLIDR